MGFDTTTTMFLILMTVPIQSFALRDGKVEFITGPLSSCVSMSMYTWLSLECDSNVFAEIMTDKVCLVSTLRLI